MDSTPKPIETVELLLEIASILMAAGANTNRVNVSIDRFASALNYKVSCFISHKTIIMTLMDDGSTLNCTRVQNIPPYAINFSIISEMSQASWSAISDKWNFEQISNTVKKIKETKTFPNVVVLLAVSLAGAGFCNIFNGDYLNMLVAFISTFTGLYIFRLTHKLNYNLYIRIFLGSITASFLASLGIVYSIGSAPQTALATSILFLVPGVALINSFTDFLDNNVINGLVRFTMGLMTVLVMAMGLFLAMYLFQLK